MWSYRVYGGGGNSGGNNNNSSDNYNKLGKEVTAEALTTIDKGDRIVGIKNDEHVTPTLVSSGAGKGISTLSADGSVGISEISNITVGSKILIHFLNENGTYDTFTLSIDEVPSGIANLGQTPIINEDGTLAISSYDAALVIKIDKKNKTATYSVVHISFSNLPTDVSGVVGNMYRAEINKGNAVLVGNHLLCHPKVSTKVVATNVSRRERNPFTILKFNGDSFELVAHATIRGADSYYAPVSIVGSNAVLLNDKDTIVTFIRDNSYYRTQMVTYKISSKTMTISGELGTFKTMYFSKNGEYLSIKPVSGNTVIKRFNQADLTYVNVGTAMSGNIDCYPSDDGTLALSTSGVFSVETGAKLYDGGCTPANICFNPKRWVSRVTSGNSTVFSIAPSTNAEYLIRVNDSYTTEDDKMYGVASENLTVGASGKAQMLFETKNSLDGLGKEVTVEALTVIDKGDKIVGIKNDEHVTPTLSSSSIGVSMSALSTDESVGISNTTIKVGAKINIFFKKDNGLYEITTLEITDTGAISTEFTSSFVVNNDGTLAMTSSGKNVLVININKRTKTASYEIITVEATGLTTYNSASFAADLTSVVANYASANIVDNYLICTSKVKVYNKSDNSTTCTEYPIVTIFKYENKNLILMKHLDIFAGSNRTYYDRNVIGNAVKIDDNILFATDYDSSNYGYIHKYDILTGALSSASMPRYAKHIYFSKNGNYVIFNSVSGSESVLYRVNLDAFSITTVKSLGIKCNDGNLCYPNNDGTLFFRTSNGVYDVQSLTKKYNGTAVPINKFFDNKRWVTSGAAYSISPSTEAEYLISTVSEYTTEPDKMYGVASESLTVGMTGTAREISNTYSAKEVTITPSTNDQVQEGLFDKVTVAGDADLVPENIKKDVEIFGVVGNCEGGATTYTVTFDSDGGSEVASQEVVEGYMVAIPETPTKTNKLIKYWALDGIEYDFYTPVTKDITLVAVWIDALVPEGYTRLDYIEGTGTQYIDTGVTVTQNTGFEIDFIFSEGNVENGRILGVGNTAWAKGLTVYQDGGLFRNGNYGNSQTYVHLGNFSTTSRNVASLKNHVVTKLDGSTHTLGSTEFTSNGTMLLFNVRFNGSVTSDGYSKMKLYSFKVYDGSVLIRNFAPAMNPENVVGLYDAVNDKFYPNAGSGSFTAGPILE